jgi:ferredoxin-type protein NapF
VTACPQEIIRLEVGLPAINFAAGECTFCRGCAEACLEPVFDLAAVRPFAHMVRVTSECLAARGVVCRTCGDSCPQAAIRFRPRIGGPALPEILDDACTGCGACVGVCPVSAIEVRERPGEAQHA